MNSSFSISLIIVLLTLSLSILSVKSWDNREIQMFDLVEELKINFYDYLDITQNATGADIRKAYRKLSIQVHPDRTKNPADSEKFQKLVAVYEILKDDEMRKKYDEVLTNGLPDWKMPIFYFRKLRKMTFWESVGLLSLLITSFHFAVLWGSYMEKKLNVEDYLSIRLRRKRVLEKKHNRGVVDGIIAEKLNTIPHPRWIDILPIALIRGGYWLVMNTPRLVSETVAEVYEYAFHDRIERQKSEQEREELEKEAQEKTERRKAAKQKKKLNSALHYEEYVQMISNNAYSVIGQIDYEELSNSDQSGSASVDAAETSGIKPQSPTTARSANGSSKPGDDQSDQWDAAELATLIEAVARFPGGTAQRWDKIAALVQRPTKQVIRMVREIQRLAACPGTNLVTALQQSGHLCKPRETDTEPVLTQSLKKPRINASKKPIFDAWESAQLLASQKQAEDSASSADGDANEDEKEDDDDDDEELSSANRRKKRRQDRRKNTALPSVECDPEPVGCGDSSTATNDTTVADPFQTLTRKKPRKKEKYLVASDSPATNPPSTKWSQEEQHKLESALRTFPKGCDERWDRIALAVESKSKAECIERVKVLASKSKSSG